jgi:hypothetical protein
MASIVEHRELLPSPFKTTRSFEGLDSVPAARREAAAGEPPSNRVLEDATPFAYAFETPPSALQIQEAMPAVPPAEVVYDPETQMLTGPLEAATATPYTSCWRGTCGANWWTFDTVVDDFDEA